MIKKILLFLMPCFCLSGCLKPLSYRESETVIYAPAATESFAPDPNVYSKSDHQAFGLTETERRTSLILDDQHIKEIEAMEHRNRTRKIRHEMERLYSLQAQAYQKKLQRQQLEEENQKRMNQRIQDMAKQQQHQRDVNAYLERERQERNRTRKIRHEMERLYSLQAQAYQKELQRQQLEEENQKRMNQRIQDMAKQQQHQRDVNAYLERKRQEEYQRLKILEQANAATVRIQRAQRESEEIRRQKERLLEENKIAQLRVQQERQRQEEENLRWKKREEERQYQQQENEKYRQQKLAEERKREQDYQERQKQRFDQRANLFGQSTRSASEARSLYEMEKSNGNTTLDFDTWLSQQKKAYGSYAS